MTPPAVSPDLPWRLRVGLKLISPGPDGRPGADEAQAVGAAVRAIVGELERDGAGRLSARATFGDTWTLTFATRDPQVAIERLRALQSSGPLFSYPLDVSYEKEEVPG